MSRPPPNSVERVGIVGAGVIGAGWAALFLAHGMEVVAWDPDPEAERKTRARIDYAWPTLAQLGMGPGADRSRIRFVATPAQAAGAAQFVQESVIEDEALKVRLLAEIDAAAAPDIVIASSSSGFLPSRLRSACRKRPERVIVAHPFNPPYVIPLVEIVGASGGDPAAIEWAKQFYTGLGRHPIVLKREFPGYVTSRILLAVFREVLYLVGEDVASVEDIDDAVVYGAGLRWAVLGMCQIFRLASQDPSQFGHFIDLMMEEMERYQLAPQGPVLRPGLRERVVAETEAAAHGRPAAELIRKRDRHIAAILQALEAAGR
jgi:carnitine 3-dehydrogenase